MSYHYVWLVWSSAFLLPWLLLFLNAVLLRSDRIAMFLAAQTNFREVVTIDSGTASITKP